MLGENEHHVLFEMRLWRAHKPNKELREKPGLLVPIDFDAHRELHKYNMPVPPPHYMLGQSILHLYRDNPDDHLRSVENLIDAVDQSLTHERTKNTEVALGRLIIHCLELQHPFIEEGLIEPNRG